MTPSASQLSIKERTIFVVTHFSDWSPALQAPAMTSNQTQSVPPDYVIKSRWLFEGIFLPSVGFVGIIGTLRRFGIKDFQICLEKEGIFK